MPDRGEPSATDYERGREAGEVAGKIDARLAGHDKHFAAINGSLEKWAIEMHTLNMQLQRLADQASARDLAAIAAASAEREIDETRRAYAADRWWPWQRVFAYAMATVFIVAMTGFLWIFGSR